MALTAVPAVAQTRQLPADSQMTRAPAPPVYPRVSPSENEPLFMIGKVPVQVWTPVEAPYDSNMNRNQAENPVWTGGMGFSDF